MKQILLSLVVVAFAPLHAEEIGKILRKSKTAGQFVTNASTLVGPDNAKFFKEKIKGMESTPLNVVQTGTNEFTFNPREAPLKFKVEDQPESLRLTLNGHTITAEAKTSREDFFNMLARAMPNKQQARSFSILPEAQAGGFKYVATAVGAVVAWAGAVGLRANGYCPKLRTALSDCDKNIYTHGKERLEKGAELVMGTENVFTFCVETKELNECLLKKQKEKNVVVGEKYLEFYGMTASAGSNASEKSAEAKK